jgi:hypothetical protein
MRLSWVSTRTCGLSLAIMSLALSTLAAPTWGVSCTIWRCRLSSETRIVVDDADGAHARRGQIHQQRRAEPAGADHQHFGRLDLLLALAADLAQHQVALVTLDLLGC